MKQKLLRDFNQILEQAIYDSASNQFKAHLMIFTFSDPNELTKQFLNKIFSRKIMDEYLAAGYVRQLSINPPTDREIEKVLFNIINKEGGTNLAVNKF